MGKLKIDGLGTVTVDDSFGQMPADQQHAFVADITQKIKSGVHSGGGEKMVSGASPAAPRVAAKDAAPAFDPNDTSPAAYGGSGPDGRLADAPTMGQLGQGINAAVGTLSRGVPFQDRIAAAGSAATGIGGHFGDYGGALADMRRQDAAEKAKLPPSVERLGNLIGGAGAAMALLPAGLSASLPRAGAALTAAERSIPMLGRGLAKVSAYAADGGILGGLQSASDAPDLTKFKDVADQSGKGIAQGAAMGATLPAAGGLLGKLYSTAAPFAARTPGMSRITSGLLGNMMTPKVTGLLDRLGPGATLADTTPSMLGLAQGVASKPGAGQDALIDMMNARHAGQSDRLVGDLNTHLGPAQSPQQVGGLLDKSNLTSPLLAQADARGRLWNPQLADLSQRPAVQRALRVASDTAANEGKPLPTVMLDESGKEVTPAARAAHDAYVASARPRLDGALGNLLGSDGALAKADDLIAQRKAAADPLYAQFRASSIPTTAKLSGLLQRPSVKSALPNAERLAQDEGKSIFVKGGDDLDHDPLGEGDHGEPPDRPDAPLHDDTKISRPVRPDVPRPQTLQDFVKDLGGVQDPKGDLKAMGMHHIPGLVAKPGKGLGPDAMRQAAAEMGYLGPHIDDAMANTTINDLHDALGNHPVHSVYDDEAVHQWREHDAAKAIYDRQDGTTSRSARPPAPPHDAYNGPEGPDGPQPHEITPEGWDYVKRALDDKIDTAKRGGANNDARVYTGLKGELTDALDKASPVYAKARQTFAGHSALVDALDQGKASIRNNVSREQLQREFNQLGTDGEKHLYRLGAAHGLRELVAQRSDGPNLAAPITGNQAMRDKLSTLAPSPQSLDRFNQAIADHAQEFSEAQRPDVRGWRYALDNLATQAGKASGDQQTAIQAAHGGLLDQLRSIPAFDRAHLIQQEAQKGREAYETGRKVLRGGDDQPWPTDLAASFAKMSPEQQKLLQIGARSDIEQRFGQNRNDLSALLRLVGGENDFNRGNMGTVFGPEATQKTVAAAEREQAFANTRNTLAAGSRTAPMQAGSKAIDEAVPPENYMFPKDAKIPALMLHGVEHVVRKGTGLLSSMANDATRNQLGNIFSATGGERDRIVRGLASDALARSRQGQLIRGLLSNPALLPAILAERRAGQR